MARPFGVSRAFAREPLTKRPGYSLLEVILASMMFAMASVVMAGVWSIHYGAISKMKHRMVVTQLAEQAMEEALASTFLDVDDVAAAYNAAAPFQVSSTFDGEVVMAEYDIDMQVNTTPDDLLKVIQVTVNWQEGEQQFDFTIESMLFKFE